jgi:hypothetical protein
LPNSAPPRDSCRPVNAEIQSLPDKFSARGNREFSNVLQGRFFGKQGNYRSTAHVDEPAGDVRFRGQSGHPKSTAPRQPMIPSLPFGDRFCRVAHHRISFPRLSSSQVFKSPAAVADAPRTDARTAPSPDASRDSNGHRLAREPRTHRAKGKRSRQRERLASGHL